jgi:hypothetical protein
MKKLCVFLAVLLFLGTTFAMSQPVPGKKFEFSTALAFFSAKADGEDSFSYLSLPFRFGWFIWKGLEIEPEVQLFIPIGEDKGDTAYFLLGKLLYNFQTSGKLVPFIGGGVGFGNGLPIFGIVQGTAGEKFTDFCGIAGVKYLIGNVAALRAEYRFNRYSWDWSDFEPAEKGTVHQIFVGLSIFF